MKAVRLNEFGDVDVLKIEDIEMPIPRSHHVLIKVDSTGAVTYTHLTLPTICSV